MLFKDDAGRTHLAWHIQLFSDQDLVPYHYFVDGHTGSPIQGGKLTRLLYPIRSPPLAASDAWIRRRYGRSALVLLLPERYQLILSW